MFHPVLLVLFAWICSDKHIMLVWDPERSCSGSSQIIERGSEGYEPPKVAGVLSLLRGCHKVVWVDYISYTKAPDSRRM